MNELKKLAVYLASCHKNFVASYQRVRSSFIDRKEMKMTLSS